MVSGNSQISGQVRIDGTAWVENAIVSDSVLIDGNANVWHGSYLNNVHITGNAIVNNSTLYGQAVVKDNAMVWGATLSNDIVAGGDAEINNCTISGVYLQVPHASNGRSACDGKGFTDGSNQDVNVAVTPFTDQQMKCMKTAGCTEPASIQPSTTRDVVIYPNPMQSRFTVELQNFGVYENPLLYIYDIQAREVIKKELKAGRTIQLNTSLLNMSKGTYLVRVLSGKMEFLKKMVVVR
jgi:hypothetical protein